LPVGKEIIKIFVEKICRFRIQVWDYNGNCFIVCHTAQIQIPIPNKYLGCGYKGLVFCRNNACIIENMDKGLTVPKWVLIVRPKIPKMPQNLPAQFVCPNQKSLGFQ
jgi:hypothetical protein